MRKIRVLIQELDEKGSLLQQIVSKPVILRSLMTISVAAQEGLQDALSKLPAPERPTGHD